MNQHQILKGYVIVTLLIEILISHTSADGFEVTPTPQMNQELQSTLYPRKWISEIFRIAKKNFTVDPSIVDKCKTDFDAYKLHTRNQTAWAIRMMESSQWPKTGLLSGLMFHPGNREECLKSRGPMIRGKYCMVTATYSFKSNPTYPKASSQLEWPLEHESAWSVVRKYETNYNRLSRQKVLWGMCMPSSCTAAQLEKSVLNTLRSLFAEQGFQVDVVVDPMTCRVQESSDSFIVVQPSHIKSLIELSIIILVVSATVFDLVVGNHKLHAEVNKEEISAVSVWRCFSVVQNYQVISRSSSKNNYGILHILKICSHIFGIFFHRYMFSSRTRNFMMDKYEMGLEMWSFEFSYYSFLNVDIFFTVTGFLLFYSESLSVKTHGISFLFRSVFFRWLRLVPVVLVMIYFRIQAPTLVNEDIWLDKEFLQQREFCQKNWWTNALAVNNIINPYERCMGSTWTVTIDLQLLVIGIMLLLAYERNRILGISMMMFTLIYSFLAVFFMVYAAKFDKPCTFTLPDENYFKTGSYFDYHVSLHSTIGPYLLGCAAAILTRKLKETNFDFSLIQKVGVILLSYLIFEGFQSYFDLFFMNFSQDKVIRNGVYIPFNRLVSVLPAATVICVYFVSGFGILNKFVESKFWVLLGNLSFSIFLIYQDITWIELLSLRFKVLEFDLANFNWLSIAGMCYTLVFAFFLYMTIEGPLLSLSRVLVMKKIKSE